MTDDRVTTTRTRGRVYACFVLPLMLTAACADQRRSRTAAPLAHITLDVSPAAAASQPVCCDLDTGRIDWTLPLRLLELRGGDTLAIPCQPDPVRPGRLWWNLSPGNDSARTRAYLLVSADRVPPPAGRLKDDGRGLDVLVHGRSVLRYNYAPVPPPEGADSLFTRSGFIHPVRTPGDQVLTAIHPSDHIHHLGIWTPWTKTAYAGRHPDFWNLGDGTGTVRFERFLSRASGGVFSGFRAVQLFVDLTARPEETPVLEEVWDIRCWVSAPPGDSRLIWDFTITQSCAGGTPLLLEEYRYGGFGFRGRRDWNETNSDYLTSDGKTRKDGNGARVRWCRVMGTLGGGTGGILFLSHPGNHAHPEPVRIWPQGEVFFGFCPVVYGEWLLEPGHTYVRRYRAVTFDGDLDRDTAETLWRQFSEPPQSTIIYYKKTGTTP
ncbi:PmoA family protein [bacterium]|nr:PmoA family protein [bacterium]